MAKFLVIAEKPSVAQSLAKNLSAYQREDGYLEGKFDADLVLGVEDGKARFSLEFPKKKK